ncbi:lytic transglycosylase domain-containing protein [Comamonas endophytica]|uniref:Lytic transglycosylase domain-containing protein n=1 Tax=Comamonas endophytica TaxID=2949090 RepID=A0ABY6GCS2_9BURK|nr:MULTISPECIES: lytic transglycosylase domain-containing protein [unclassified Acidovorax]MCD2513654.1 lytic transglycosylase domain-containing protein [Acidovorax sp. D4N7]UYG52337.1 lytic transglycosylase domain-containing protein [Acidovorax sp. 5MLIR]
MTCPARPLLRRSSRHRLLAAGLLCLGLAAAGGARADLWAFVDARGVTHFAAEQLDERYTLFFRGPRFDSELDIAAPMQPGTAPAARTRVQSYFDLLPAYKSARPHLRRAAERSGVDYALLKAVIATESGFDTLAVSPKGALGLMQLMPATAERFGVAPTRTRSLAQQLHDPAVNVPAGARYLAHLLDLFDGRLELALAAYNAGEGAVRRAGQKIPPYRETQNYVKTVLALYRQLQPLAPVAAARAEGGARSSRIRMTLPGGASGTFDEKREQ